MKKDTQLFGTRMPQEFKDLITNFIKKQQKTDIEFSTSKLLRTAIKEYIERHS